MRKIIEEGTANYRNGNKYFIICMKKSTSKLTYMSIQKIVNPDQGSSSVLVLVNTRQWKCDDACCEEHRLPSHEASDTDPGENVTLLMLSHQYRFLLTRMWRKAIAGARHICPG